MITAENIYELKKVLDTDSPLYREIVKLEDVFKQICIAGAMREDNFCNFADAVEVYCKGDIPNTYYVIRHDYRWEIEFQQGECPQKIKLKNIIKRGCKEEDIPIINSILLFHYQEIAQEDLEK